MTLPMPRLAPMTMATLPARRCDCCMPADDNARPVALSPARVHGVHTDHARRRDIGRAAHGLRNRTTELASAPMKLLRPLTSTLLLLSACGDDPATSAT